MRRALTLAARGIGFVEPNPPVGAVIVDDDLRVIGEGWHERFGGPHAEINALRQAGERARGATMFVSLEPCCHHGKTPPCADALIAAGLRRVLVATQDPAPHVSGGGMARLREAGVEVEAGLLEPESRRLIAPFIKRVTTGRP
ncbi:MAG: bifunctional diaminohydroxyphosphoribosylaminopyrimidine deaminase/5-amino-6-(5-phosphoribosylamino)uracil reductase RibD, partial [Planctomycetaceae bacterium]